MGAKLPSGWLQVRSPRMAGRGTACGRYREARALAERRFPGAGTQPTRDRDGPGDPRAHPPVKAVDSSVVIAAFASWHEHHAIARKAMTAPASPDRPRSGRVLLGTDQAAAPEPGQSRHRPRVHHRALHRSLPHPVRERLPGTPRHSGGRADPRRTRLRRTDRPHSRRAQCHSRESLDQRAGATYETVGAHVEQLPS